MKSAFYIFIGYSILGLFYVPSMYTLITLIFISFSCYPLFIAGKFSEISERMQLEYKTLSWFSTGIFFIIGIINLYFVAANAGHSFTDIFSISGIKEISMRNSEIRYFPGYENNNSGNPWLFSISLYSIFRVALKSDTKKIKVVLLFIPIIMYTLLTTEKWPTFLSLVFYFSAVSSSYLPRETCKILLSNLKYLIIIIIFMIVSLSLRYAENQNILHTINLLLHYILSPYYGFGVWLTEHFDKIDLTYGKMTFIGPLSYFSSITDVERPPGVFDISYYVYGNASNIYTAFRYLIEDYSVFGPVIINTIFSLIYYKLTKNKLFYLSLPLKTLFIFCALLSLTVTPAVNNSVLLAILLCLTYIFYTAILPNREKKNECCTIYR
ncbi:O-antigen polymerase [Morganella morganii]|nr:oligosaccharide repeat unit polymerase [Morganella morganii]